MGGNDHIPTAPRDVIGDDGDLRQMRDALRAGKTVTLAYDGKVYVAAQATAPMSPAHEQFIESKLGHVVELARSGYGVSVHPDGTISADRADHLSKVLYDPDPALSEQQRLLIQRGVSEGGQVRVHSDGRVEYFLAKDARPPHPAQAVRLQQAVDEEIRSGRLLEALRNGETLSANPDGSLDYIRTGPGPAPIEFPEDGRQDAGSPATSDDLEAEAHALELGVGAARLGAAAEYEAASTDAVVRRDEAARLGKAADAAQAEAERQVTEKQAVAARIRAEQGQVAAEVARARSEGDLRRAEELGEKLDRLHIEERAADAEVVAAGRAAAAGKAEMARQAEVEARSEAAAGASFTRRQTVEDVFDQQEDQARAYRQAADELREAERLEAAYADLQSRGVAGAERVQQAAAAHRAKAGELRRQAESFDASPAAGAAAAHGDTDVPSPVRLPPPIFDGEESVTGAEADPTEVAAAGADSPMDEGAVPVVSAGDDELLADGSSGDAGVEAGTFVAAASETFDPGSFEGGSFEPASFDQESFADGSFDDVAFERAGFEIASGSDPHGDDDARNPADGLAEA